MRPMRTSRAWMLLRNSRETKPCCTCHTRLGKKMSRGRCQSPPTARGWPDSSTAVRISPPAIPASKEGHGVLGHHPQANGCQPDTQPPAGVACFHQPDGEVGNQAPPQVVEGNVHDMVPIANDRGGYGPQREQPAPGRDGLLPSLGPSRPESNIAPPWARAENSRRPVIKRGQITPAPGGL